MASYQRLPSGKWRVQVRKQGVYAARSFTTKGQAQTWARKTEIAIEDGIFGLNCETPLLTEALDRYEKEVSSLKKGARSERSRIRVLQGISRGQKEGEQESFQWSDWPLSKLGVTDIAEIRDFLLKERAPETVRKYLSLLSDLFTHARREWGYDLKNPVADVRKPKPCQARNRRLTKAEEKVLLAAVDKKSNKEFGAIVRLGLYTGMRQGEIIGLRWEYVDLRKKVAVLSKTKNGDIRGVPLSSQAVKVIKSLDMKKSGQIFGYTDSGFRALWRRMVLGLGMADFRFHDLRHEATSRFFEKGLNPMEVASITGHKTMHMLKRYTHLRAEDLARKLG